MLVEPPVTEILKKVDDRYSLIIMTYKKIINEIKLFKRYSSCKV